MRPLSGASRPDKAHVNVDDVNFDRYLTANFTVLSTLERARTPIGHVLLWVNATNQLRTNPLSAKSTRVEQCL